MRQRPLARAHDADKFVLGVNAYHGDSSACLLRDGEIVAAAEEERFRRIKHWAGLPSEAIKYCLREADVRPKDIGHVAFSRNPMAHLHSKLMFVAKSRPGFGLIKSRLANMARMRSARDELSRSLGVDASSLRAKVHRVEHHRAHSASAFLVSPFEEAAVVSIDAFGDFRSTMVSLGQGAGMQVLSTVGFPHSLGLLYTAVTQYLGFPRYGDEYKVMGLAAYGQPTYLDEFRAMVRCEPKGKFKLDLKYFLHSSKGVSMTWDNVEPHIDRAYSDHMLRRLGPTREQRADIAKRDQDIAASLQAAVEEVYFHVLNYAHAATGSKSLSLAGGVAFNSVANGRIFDQTPFEEVYIQAAAGDAGTALGAAYRVYHEVLGNPRKFTMDSAYWGPNYDESEYAGALERHGLQHNHLSDKELYQRTAQAIAEGKIVGWFQGRAEWGPRALGNRSILADPRRADMKDILNSRIKRREPFRPFAPSILLEAVGEYFEKTYPDPFMIKVYPIKEHKRQEIPAVTHVDGTGRLQTVSKEDNPRFWALIKEFHRQTGVPILLNTSFNENEPIVCNPEQAIQSYLRTKIDLLVLGNYLVERSGGPDPERPSI